MYRASLFLVLVVGLVMGQSACTEEEKKRPTDWPDGWILPDGPKVLDASVSDMKPRPDVDHNPNGPMITILTPTAGQIVTASTLTVRARIIDKSLVDYNSIKIVLEYGSTKEAAKSMAATSTPNEYKALLDVSKVKGAGRITVTAKNLKKIENKAIVDFAYDSGPSITFTAPGPKSNHNSKVTVQLLVTDTVDITGFKLLLGADKVLLKRWTSDKNLKQQVWSGDVVFANYTPPLSGSQVLTAEATNKNGATSTKSLQFNVDDSGPTITITSQSAGQLIGGVVKLSAIVKDTAGVLASSVKCVIGNGTSVQTITLKNTSSAQTIFTGQFDTRTLLQSFLWPVMSFRATDKLGNESHNDIIVGLDNGKPIMELDPPEDYHQGKKKQAYTECSRPFDPVGSDAADDKMQVPQVTFIRGRFQDQGNDINSAPWIPIAGLDDGSVFLYILDDTKKALVYDNDGDGYCDAINPEIVPLASKPGKGEAVAVKMAAAKPTGSADFRHPLLSGITDTFSSDAGTSGAAKPPSSCQFWGGSSKKPNAMCQGTTMTSVISYAGNLSAIYSLPPISGSSSGYTCSGLPFDFKANKISDGWVCVAATIKDKLGNRGVTPPIRLYVNNSSGFTKMTTKLPASAGIAPNCTGSLNKATGKVETQKPCKFRNPRQGSIPSLKVYKCDVKMAKKQMYCHNEVSTGK